MTARKTVWKEYMRGFRCELHADTRDEVPFDASELDDRTMYVMCCMREHHRDTFTWEVSYWKIEPPDEGDDPLMCGDWVDLPRVATLEEAKLIAENIVRLNLGGWP